LTIYLFAVLLRILTKNSDNFSRVYVDVVFNHMTADYPNAVGVGGTRADTYNKQYPGVSYGPGDFNPCREITDWNDPWQVSNNAL
jgi:hypothetical protein